MYFLWWIKRLIGCRNKLWYVQMYFKVSFSIRESLNGINVLMTLFLQIEFSIMNIFNHYVAYCLRTKDFYKQPERQKKLVNEQGIIDVEHINFNPLACTGDGGPSASEVMSWFALKISEKRPDRYCEATSFICTKKRICGSTEPVIIPEWGYKSLGS